MSLLLRYIGVIFLLWVGAAAVQASAGMCTSPGPGTTCGGPAALGTFSPSSIASPSLLAANPIHIATGNKVQHEIDLPALPGALGLEISRTYHSRLQHRGLIGYGWQLAYETRLYFEGPSLQIFQADGRRLIFARHPKDKHLCVSTQPQDGHIRQSTTSDGTTLYHWHWPSGRILTFRPTPHTRTAALIRIEEPGGAWVSLHYDANQRLHQVKNAQGQRLTFHLTSDAERRAALIHAIESPVGLFHFRYDRHNNLISVTSPPDPSVANGQPITRHYHYEADKNGGDVHNLTGISQRIGPAHPDRRFALDTYQPNPGSPSSDATASPDTGQRLATYYYNAQDMAVQSTLASGHSVQLQYLPASPDAQGRIVAQQTRLTDEKGQSTLYTWEQIGQHFYLTQGEGPGCASCPPIGQWRYNAQGSLISQSTQSQGTQSPTLHHEYDPQQRLIATWRQTGATRQRIERRQYTGTQRQPSLIATPSIVPGKERIVRIVYGDTLATASLPITISEEGWSPGVDTPSEPIQRSASFRYNVQGQLLALDGPFPGESDTIRYERDSLGRIVRIRHPVSDLQEQFLYDAMGRLVQHTPVDAVPVRLRYDHQRRLTRLERAGQMWEIRRDGLGRATQRITQPGETLDLRYGPDNQTVRSSAGWVKTLESGTDSQGRFVQERLQTLIQTQTDTWHVDDQGRVLQHTAPDGGRTQARYSAQGIETEDALGRIYRAAFARPQTEPSGVLLAAHDAVSGMESVLSSDQPKRRWTDDFGRIVAERLPGRGLTRYRHDPADRLIERIDADGGHVLASHDAAGRLLRRSVRTGPDSANAVTTRFRYFGAYRVGIEHPNQHVALTYNPQGRLATQTTTQAGHTYVETFRYSSQGQLIERRLADGSRLRWQYDTQGHPHSLTVQAPGQFFAQPLAQVRNQDGIAPTRIALPNGSEWLQERHANGRLARIAYLKKDNPLIDWRYTFDLGSRLVQRSERIEQTSTHYAYDALDRPIVAETHPLQASGMRTVAAARPTPIVERLAFDQAGNLRLKQNAQGQTQEMHYLNATHMEATYDAVGRPLAWQGMDLSYGIEGRLERLSKNGQVLQSNQYNGFGERIAKTSAQGTTGYLYTDHRLSAELDRQGRIKAQYVYFNGQPIARIDCVPACAPVAQNLAEAGGGIKAFLHRAWRALSSLTGIAPKVRILTLHADPLGTVHAVTDEDAKPVWQAHYDLLGRATIKIQKVRFDLRLAGQVEDEETGLRDNYLRTYDPNTGRYLEPDPLGWYGDTHPYLYAAGHFTQGSDPLGLILFAFDGTNNSDYPVPDDHSNVYKFYGKYGDGDRFYMSGVGTYDLDSGIGPSEADSGGGWDIKVAYTASRRISYMVGKFHNYLRSSTEPVVTIDVVGFSRGAAMARDFVNQLRSRVIDGGYAVGSDRPRCVRFRFLGLWDTVLSYTTEPFNLDIPPEIEHVAHAVAVNEHRTLFPGESIRLSPEDISYVGVRNELGFIGAHSDIGGGYSEGDLSDVTLIWMHQQAGFAGIIMWELSDDQKKVTAPLWHDSNIEIMSKRFDDTGDREFRFRNGAVQNGKTATVYGMHHKASIPFLHKYATPKKDAYGNPVVRGTVDMKEYAAWLKLRYGIEVGY